MEDWLSHLNPAWLALIRVLLFVVPILLLVPGFIWLERRLLSWMQDRIGPNRTGTITLKNGKKIRTFGLVQPIADGVKLFFKEDITPAAIDRLIYFVSPAIALFPAFALGGTVPWGPHYGVYGLLTPIADVDIGLLYILAISSLGVYGVVLAGYASNNKYSLMGGLRASAQLISYELAMGVSLACIVMASGSLRLIDIVKSQESALWGILPYVQNWFVFTPFGFLSAIIFGICMVAETNRAPFDLPEAENEIIAGYHTEYSSMKFAVFFMGEYAAMFVFSMIFATIFLGGYNALPINWHAIAQSSDVMYNFASFMEKVQYYASPLVLIGKAFTGIAVYIWIRATLPRLRYDQLMALGWKTLLPAAVANFIVVAIWILTTKIYGVFQGMACAAISYAVLYWMFKGLLAGGVVKRTLEKRTVDLVEQPAARSAELVESVS